MSLGDVLFVGSLIALVAVMIDLLFPGGPRKL
jgi:hypothetical protein